jgi:hypothetical protein
MAPVEITDDLGPNRLEFRVNIDVAGNVLDAL